MFRAARPASAGSSPTRAKSSRSLSSTGVVRWLIPTVKRRMLEVVALRQEVPDGQKVEEDDDKANRRDPGRPPPTPADHAPRIKGEGIHAPAHQRDQDLRVCQRHRLRSRIRRLLDLARPDAADRDTDGQE